MAKAGRGAVMAATVISNDSGAELRGSRSDQNTQDSVLVKQTLTLDTVPGQLGAHTPHTGGTRVSGPD